MFDLIYMAAPRRRPVKSAPSPAPTNAAHALPALQGGLSTSGTAPTRPVQVVKPASSFSENDLFMMKLSQAVMLGIGFLAIWGGVFSVAFDEEATNDNFLVLFVGGLASFLVTIGLIELQSKKNGYHLHDIQNYFLGIAFFFSTVGVLWGTRYMMGLATGTLELDWFGAPSLYTEQDWSPNANGIYAQTLTCLMLTYGHYRLLKRYSGDTSFGWGVATYAPMAVLIAGVGPWIRWSENVVSWELGIAMLSITLVSLEMSLRSNKALNFVVVAFAGALVPIIYETLNSNAPADGAGGALSLMVFIIAMQGYYASRADLRKEVMERASLLLIGQVVVAIALARTAPEFNLILGPFRAGDYPALADYINIPVALWCTVLLAYFPAVLQQRVPWMPVGLAVALMALPMSSSTVPWVLSMLVIPYMVFISKVAREWVVNLTMLAFSASYLLTDWYAYANDISAQDAFGGTWLHVIIPVFLLGVAEFGRSRSRLQTSITLAMIGSVVLSRAILDPEWYLPWLLVAYMFFLNWNLLADASKEVFKDRTDVTLAVGFTSITILLLAIIDNLTLPSIDALDPVLDTGFRPQFLVLSLAMFVLTNKASGYEFDMGSIFRWLNEGNADAPIFDPTTGTWSVVEPKKEAKEGAIVEAEWSPIARLSLLSALALFTFSISQLSVEVLADHPYVVLLVAVPVALLVRELVSLETISSGTRASGVAMLVFLSAPLSFGVGQALADGEDLRAAAVLLDLVIVAAPLVVNAMISRRGLDMDGLSRTADGVSYAFLLVLALLDVSGGVLLLPLAVLVAARTVSHRFHGFTILVPLVFLIPPDRWWDEGVFALLIEALPAMFAEYFMNTHNGPFWSIIGLFVVGHMSALLFVLYRDNDEATTLWAMIGILWFILGLFSALPDGYWIPTLVTLLLMPYLWYTNRSEGLPYMLGILFVSLFLGFTLSDTFQPISDGDAASWSGLLTGFAGVVMGALHTRGKLFQIEPEGDDERRSQDATAALTLQIGAVGFIIGYAVFFGLGPVIGLVLVGRTALRNGQTNSLLLMPVLFSFSVYNLMVQSDLGDGDLRTTVVGLTLATQGLLLTLLSMKDDLVYEWDSVDWESDEAFFAFMDRLGIAGLAYTLIGIAVTLTNVDLESLAYLLMTVFLVFTGIQGFSEEHDARWRRGLGGYGAIFTAFLFANSLEDNLFGAIGFVLMGMVALGFGFLFMQRMNEEDAIYVEEAVTSPSVDGKPPMDEVQEPGEEEVAEVSDASATGEEGPESEETPEEVADDLNEEHAEDDLVMFAEERENEAAVDASRGLLETGQGFSLRLPPDAVDNILATLKTTPHHGYRPVVAFGPSGQIMLTFEDLKA
jgi:hypothetical protein